MFFISQSTEQTKSVKLQSQANPSGGGY